MHMASYKLRNFYRILLDFVEFFKVETEEGKALEEDEGIEDKNKIWMSFYIEVLHFQQRQRRVRKIEELEDKLSVNNGQEENGFGSFSMNRDKRPGN